MKKVVGFHVSTAIVRVFHLVSLARKRVQLIEETDHIELNSSRENGNEAFLGLADIFAAVMGKVYVVHIQVQLTPDAAVTLNWKGLSSLFEG